MKVFISWSGPTSHELALLLKDWLSSVIQQVEPFVSSEDIQKGARWFEVIGGHLEETHFGILCLTPDNLAAPWVLFEAGAMAKKLDQAHVAPVLLNVTNAQLVGPLAQFNTTATTQDDLKKLIRTINGQLGDKALPDNRLDAAFAKWWPDLESKLKALQERKAEKKPQPPRRDANEMVEEILTLVRTISQDLARQRPGGVFAELPHTTPANWWPTLSDAQLSVAQQARSLTDAQIRAALVGLTRKPKGADGEKSGDEGI